LMRLSLVKLPPLPCIMWILCSPVRARN
jgi:hypothetical protein